MDTSNFAQRAGAYFAKNNKATLFTDNGLVAGDLLAIRYGIDDVLVVKIDESLPPIIWKDVIKRAQS